MTAQTEAASALVAVRSSRRERSTARTANIIALLLFAGGTCASAATLTSEGWAQGLAATARAAVAGLPSADRASARAALSGCETSRDERVLLSCISGSAGLARSEPDGSALRAADLARGRIAATAFGARVPVTGDALAATVFLESVDPASEGAAVAALRESYVRQPYSRDAGLWRLWYASRHWNVLDSRTRRAMLAEAIWYGSIGKPDRDAVIATLLGTPPFVTVDLRLPGYPGEALPLPTRP